MASSPARRSWVVGRDVVTHDVVAQNVVVIDGKTSRRFRDDECRLRTDHAPANFTTVKHIALDLTDARLRRKVADFLVSLVAA